MEEDTLDKLSGDLLYLWENHFPHKNLRKLMEDIFPVETPANIKGMRAALNKFLDDQGF
jgi:hypothetical protein